MRLRLILFLLAISTEVLPRQVDHSLSSAISRILNQNFEDSSGKVDFVLCGSINSQIGDLFEQILRQSNKLLSVKLASCDGQKIRLSTSSVLIFESPEIFKKKVPKIAWQMHKSKRYRHLVHILDGKFGDIDSVLDGSIDNTAFLVDETEKSISLATSFMFSVSKCREKQLLVINRFEKYTMEWESDVFFPKKYRNLHSCDVRQVASKYDTGKSLYDKILADMSTIFDFKISKIYLNSLEDLKALKKKVDFVKIITSLESDEYVQLVVSSEQGIYIVPPGEPLTKMQKFLSPFDSTTWWFTLATLMMTFVAIQLASFASVRVQTLCFGRNIGSPTMNLMNVFLCGGQTQDPENYLARYIFLLFLIWSLIIRTCFQSLSYRALQLDNRHPPMKTFDDLREHEFLQFVVTYPLETPPDDELENSFYRYAQFR